MDKVYIKNFKGFNEQIVELEDVNFLVGENSTGKTSFINLVSLLSSQEFWFNNQFSSGEIDMGYFDEIISNNAIENTFKIGTERVEQEVGNKVKKERRIRILVEFKPRNSIPQISWIKYSVNNLNVFVNANSKKLKGIYNFRSIATFEEWIDEQKDVKGDKIDIDLPSARFPITFIFQLITKQIKEKAKNEVEKVDFHDGLLFRRYTWLAPIRAKAKRIYESYNVKFSPEGEHVPLLLESLLSSKRNKKRILDILQKFGKESNLYDSIEIKRLGNKKTSPFEVLIRYNERNMKLPNVGYGVAQILPIIVEILASSGTTFSIQQPEVHLHPKAQAAFGHFIYKACQNDQNKFLIETHSDFTINRFRHQMFQNNKPHNFKAQVLFFERTNDGNRITHLKIEDNGSYENNLIPDSYRSFFIDEELKLLEL